MMESVKNTGERIAEKMRKSGTRKRALEINQDLFSALLVTFLLLLLTETIWEGSVTPYLNITFFMVIVLISGVVLVFTPKEETTETAGYGVMTKRDYALAMAAGIAGSIIIWYKIPKLGWQTYLISLVSGVLIVLLSLLIIEEDETEQDDSNLEKGK